MVDQILSLMVQHYLICGIVALVLGILLNLAISVAPEITQSLRSHRLY